MNLGESLVLLFLFAAVACCAQPDGASVTGYISDRGDAIVPEVGSTSTHVLPGRSTSTAANSTANYSLALLSIRKTVNFQAPGFKKSARSEMSRTSVVTVGLSPVNQGRSENACS